MSKKKTCCDFWRNLFKKPQKDDMPPPNQQISTEIKTHFEENTEIATQKKIGSESKRQVKDSCEISLNLSESFSNSIFYDKNSALVEVIDKNKAAANLEEAYKIIHKEDDSVSFRNSLDSPEMFSKVIKGINFKEILAKDDAAILSGSSGRNSLH